MKSLFISVDDYALAAIHNEISNSDSLIVFLHGLGCSKRSFCNIQKDARFLEKSFLMIDLIGFGESSKSNEFSYSMEEQAAMVEAVLNQLNPKELILVVHSMGGAVALLFSDVFYQRVSAFANVEGNLIGADCGLYSRGIVKNDFDFYKKCLFPKQIKDAADIPMLDLEQTTPLAMFKSAQSLVELSDSNRLLKTYQSLRCKKSYFYGDRNSKIDVVKMLPNGETIQVPNSGHGMMFDNPSQFQDLLYTFLFK